ncbi:MAG: hypothetical protein U0232_19250 [Thermomicrobiales bacterium]
MRDDHGQPDRPPGAWRRDAQARRRPGPPAIWPADSARSSMSSTSAAAAAHDDPGLRRAGPAPRPSVRPRRGIVTRANAVARRTRRSWPRQRKLVPDSWSSPARQRRQVTGERLADRAPMLDRARGAIDQSRA